jgi:predicted transcriptional regulator of viral defense system
LVAKGKLERLHRGVYKSVKAKPLQHETFVEINLSIPKAVVCLSSALEFHGLIDSLPARIHIALPQGSWQPKLDYPQISLHHFAPTLYEFGIEEHSDLGQHFKVYNLEKSLADSFFYRERLGEDLVLEALKNYLTSPQKNLINLEKAARLRRVHNTLSPYVKALL